MLRLGAPLDFFFNKLCVYCMYRHSRRDLNSLLESYGLALENMGATAAQTVSGATSTGTHGTGKHLGSMSTQIVGIRMVLADGTIMVADEENNQDLLKIGRVGLGALGIISTITFRVVPLWNMKLSIIDMDLTELLDRHDEFYEKYDRFQWGYVPYSDPPVATVMLRENTDEAITPGGCWEPTVSVKEQPCVDVSYKTLVDSLERYDNRTIYTEIEIFVPQEHLKEAILDYMSFQESVREQHDDSRGTLFTNIRYIKGDDITLSPMRGRDSAVISFTITGDRKKTGDYGEFEMFAKGLEEVTRKVSKNKDVA